MRNAIPVTPPTDRVGRFGTGKSPGSDGPAGTTAPAAPTIESDGFSPTITESDATGKVFFTQPGDGRDYVCSASALNSDSKQMVITAGHCVHEGRGGTWMRNWTYVPRYRNGNRPLGTFAAKEYRTFNGWINNSDFNWDVAMVTTHPLNGRKLVNVTGGHGLGWNFSRSENVTVLGYPGNRDNGQVQWSCVGRTERVSLTDGRIQLNCNFGGGSSGGPWLHGFNDSTGRGSVIGVTSTVTGSGWNRSPYFDNSVKSMFDAQGGRT
ncbi:serine protease [Streptomyces sp. ST2-7A]|uniref:trypsin-like serine peptidase n=1 Tax=Streptomyces sp. ST2-7A TaxID=2907214 RepID=UPI001F425412|nr:trypsin-like peptidase domain-containing protein [Streptomyces sp. ST2-7A]MCE7080505.1 trypsin-like peptidase domain-containing protein [Streptomyces sp. ST2-7A]